MNILGLMSGTSADAIDAAVVAIQRDGAALTLHLLGAAALPYPPDVRSRLRALLPPATGSTQDVCELGVLVGEAFAAAAILGAAAADLPLDAVDLVASHGQTVYHQVSAGRPRSTLQLGAPAIIAARTGRTVAADFRPRDIAEGGQGAPLLPLLDTLLYAHPEHSRALQNIGGIANVTYLPAYHEGTKTRRQEDQAFVSSCLRGEYTLQEAIAFDTGPGNCLIDELTYTLSGGRLAFDDGGAWALQGRVDEELLAAWLADPYYDLPPPKSTGREYFSRVYAARLLSAGRVRGLADADVLATVTALTARSIAHSYRRWLPALPDEVLLSGGGAHNRALIAMLACELTEATIRPIDALGLPGDAKEAVGFALLGYYTLHGWPGNLPHCTGAGRPAVLGSITPGDNYRELMRRVLVDERGPPMHAGVIHHEGTKARRPEIHHEDTGCPLGDTKVRRLGSSIGVLRKPQHREPVA